MQLQNIIFPVDFSERSHAAAPFVQSMARRYGATTTLLHVIAPVPPVYFESGFACPETFDLAPLVSGAEQRLSEFAAEQFPRTQTRCMVVQGDPARTIVDLARETKADLIALPTHGYGFFRRALLGSVTAKVLHDSSVPVWTSAHCAEASHRAHPQPRVIIAAIDLKEKTERTLQTALALAEQAGATVEVLHMTTEGDAAPMVPEMKVERALAVAAASGALAVERREPAKLQVLTHGESVEAVVRRVALSKRADLVVIGRGHMHGGAMERIHSHAYAVICESPCPVISV